MELLGGLAIVKKVIDIVRYIGAGDTAQYRQAAVVLLSFGVGVGLAFLVAASSLAESVGLADAGVADVILAGIGVGASAGVVHDIGAKTEIL